VVAVGADFVVTGVGADVLGTDFTGTDVVSGWCVML